MENFHKELLRDRRVDIKDQICYSVTDLANYLESKLIIAPEMTETILCDGTGTDKAYRLLSMLPHRGCNAFQTFYEATCHCQLWGAADILEPNKAPHEQNDDLRAARRNVPPARPPNAGENQGQGMQMNLNLVVNPMVSLPYAPALHQEGRPNHQHNPSYLSRQQNQEYSYSCPVIGPQYTNKQQLLCHDGGGTRQIANLDTFLSVSQNYDITKCQDLIKHFKVPLNINDYITLAALEEKANLEDRKAHEFITCMASKTQKYREAKINELTSDTRMTPEKAIRRYITMSQPHRSYSDFKFFQVWGMTHPILVGPTILAINSQTIMFLDFATKNPKVNSEWSLDHLDECRKSNDYIFSVILQFQDQTTLTLLSLEFEEICQELDTLIEQRA